MATLKVSFVNNPEERIKLVYHSVGPLPQRLCLVVYRNSGMIRENFNKLELMASTLKFDL